jgi:hypothetical protein
VQPLFFSCSRPHSLLNRLESGVKLTVSLFSRIPTPMEIQKSSATPPSLTWLCNSLRLACEYLAMRVDFNARHFDVHVEKASGRLGATEALSPFATISRTPFMRYVILVRSVSPLRVRCTDFDGGVGVNREREIRLEIQRKFAEPNRMTRQRQK